MQKEPAMIVSGVSAFVVALIMLLVAFGVDFSEEQRNAIVGMIAPTVGMFVLLGGLIRQFVYSPKTVKEIADQQYVAGVPPTEPQPPVPPPAEPVKQDLGTPGPHYKIE